MSGTLNPAQRKAVNTLSGPLLVLAGAGTGKTRVVTFRIAELIRHKTPPGRILAVTFTNKAAGEMQQRIRELLGRSLRDRPQISTFHAYCLKILRRHLFRLGYPKEFAIYDRGDQESLARAVLREIHVSDKQLRPGDLLASISRWKSISVLPSAAVNAASTDRDHVAALGYRRYQRALKNAGAVDFDDLLLCTEELFAKFPEVRAAEARCFDHLLVDEYQDTNASQYRIIKELAREHRNLCVVGDDDQSIYGWRGAEVRHILHFARDWPDATIVRLEENYRCTAAILELANRVISFNRQRYPKILQAARPGGERPRIYQYKNETEEAESVVGDIRRRLHQPGTEPHDFAILFRTNEQPRAFETELRRAKLPYVLLGSMSFFDRKEVRDVLAYLRLLESPGDELSLLRIINTPPRGLGQKSVETLLQRAVGQGKPLPDVLRQPTSYADLPLAARKGLQTLLAQLEQVRQLKRRMPLVEQAKQLLEIIGYRAELNRIYSDPDEQSTRWRTVEEVVNALAEYEAKSKHASLTGFLDEIALGGREFEKEKDDQLKRNAVALMTLHSAKGLEFPHVYMVGLEEGFLPHRRSLAENADDVDEERRLCYVGMTRAQESLTLSLALTRLKWGKPRETQPSRFLFEAIGQAERATDKRKRVKR